MRRCSYVIAGHLLLVAALLLLAGCGEDAPQQSQEKGLDLPDPTAVSPALPPEGNVPALVDLFHEGALLMDRAQAAKAVTVYRRAIDRAPGWYATWLNLGIALMNTGSTRNYPNAEKCLECALRLDPEGLTARHALGILATQRTPPDPERAEGFFRAVLERDPADWGANYQLASLLIARDQGDEALVHLERALDDLPHLSSALYQKAKLLLEKGRMKERGEALRIFKELTRTETGVTFAIAYNEMGPHSRVVREVHVPGAPTRSSTDVTPAWKPARGDGTVERIAPGDGARPGSITVPAGRRPADILGATLPGLLGPGAALADVDRDGDLDLYVADGVGPGRLLLNEQGRFVDASRAWGLTGGGRSVSGVFGDLDDDGDADLYVACAGPNRLFRNEGSRFVDATQTAGVSGGNRFTVQAAFADLDADADLDLYLANLLDLDAPATDADRSWPRDFPGASNLLLNNDRNGRFRDITERTGTSAGATRSIGVVASDLDRDADADLLVLSLGQPAHVLRNDRIWRFRDLGDLSGSLTAPGVTGAWSADLDRDGLPEILLLAPSGNQRLLRNLGSMRFARHAPWTQALKGVEASSGAVLDADNDGLPDLLLAGDGTATLLRGTDGGSFARAPAELTGLPGPALRCVLAADLDGNRGLDLVATHTGRGARTWLSSSPVANHRLLLGLGGRSNAEYVRANTGGVGAWVEIVTGTHHQFAELMTTGGVLGGLPACLHFGTGSATGVDYMRIVWPDDVIQAEPGLPVDQPKRTVTEVARKSSSCPLLFTWDGERWVYVTDFLGVGGLGFFLEPGVYAPPDPTESVKVPVLAPRNGAWELRVHEPMEEILYLDAARLVVVDHPPGTEVWPDERLAVEGDPPTGRPLVVRSAERLFPRGLATRAGPADATLVHAADRRYQPGVRKDRRFLGFAEPQEIVLDFGPGLSRFDGRLPLFLFLEGWVEYPYSCINFAAWQAGLQFEALSLDVETVPGTWQPVLERFGYPAGLPRMMTVDVSRLPRTGTGRLRLRTNIELYIDRVFLAEDHGLEAARIRRLLPDEAVLRSSGYPREYSPDGAMPLLYDYALMDPAIEFKTMEGAYTRFGDVTPLLTAADDRYVIMGRAEEIVLRYPVVPAPGGGMQRSFILESDGWCKDMDLYTAHPHTVGPLPFRSMSSYPYPETESFPQTPEHEAWKREWNTRFLHGTRTRGKR